MRPLRYEPLERRDLLTAIRLAAWNTENGPNDAVDDADFAAIFRAIGDEAVAGNSGPIGVLALQETDISGSGGDSIGRAEAVFDTLYPSTDYASVVAGLDGGGDATGFVYDTSQVELLSTVDLSQPALTHSILRGEFRPIGGGGDTDFFVYSIHLDAGNTLADAASRGAEAAVLRADADQLGEGANILYVGDFNLQGSDEPAFVEFAAPGPGQARDVVDALGDWNDNPAFLALHSQDPGTSVDDRFDLHLASGEFFDGTGIEYVDGSYRVFGNNGTHTLNEPITTGTGASQAVLEALARASDHLPVVADYQVDLTGPRVIVTQTGDGTEVVEGGPGDTYTVALSETPAAPVTVTITPEPTVDVGAGFGTPVDLLFTVADALAPQAVTASVLDDNLAQAPRLASITHATASNDPAFDMLGVPGVTLLINDNDTPSVTVSELQYDPASEELAPGVAEWIEIANTGTTAVDLSGWLFDDEDATNWSPIAEGTILGVEGVAVFFDAEFTDAATFRSEWGVPSEALVIGLDWGALANTPSAANEILQLLDSEGNQQDLVNYDDANGFPNNNNRSSIAVIDLTADNNAGVNFRLSAVGVAGAVSPNGPAFSPSDVGSPGVVPIPAPPVLAGDFNDDGFVNAADYVVFRDLAGTRGPLANETASPGIVDGADFALFVEEFGEPDPAADSVVSEQLPPAFASALDLYFALVGPASEDLLDSVRPVRAAADAVVLETLAEQLAIEWAG